MECSEGSGDYASGRQESRLEEKSFHYLESENWFTVRSFFTGTVGWCIR